MNKDKYEISIWEDYPVAEEKKGSITIPAHYEERKIAIIGSNTLSSPCRAYNPKLEQNINGTNTFSFEMFQTYRENFVRDGKDEILTNPFLALLSNERKIKVLWKNKWYDFVIKNISEDTSSRKNTYTCQDLYINELSKNGFNLTFDSELGNNEGTAQELVEKVLEGTDWTLDKNGSQGIQQKKEEPVFEFLLPEKISAKNQSKPKTNPTEIANDKTILLFYNQIQSLVETTSRISIDLQFAYADNYETETNSQLVTNADCYVATFWYTKDKDGVKLATSTGGILEGLPSVVSNRYRAERLVLSKIRKFDPLTKKYCYVLKRKGSDDEIYEFSESKFSDALSVQNLFVNSSNFTNSQGWERIGIQSVIPLGIYKNEKDQYENTYIRIYPKTSNSENIYKNRGLLVNSVNIPEHGFGKGEKYIIKYRCRQLDEEKDGRDPIKGSYTVYPDLSFWVEDPDAPEDTKYFFGPVTKEAGWIQDELTSYWSIEVACSKSISKEQIQKKKLLLCIQNNNEYSRWLEDIQFFPAVYNEVGELVEPDKFDTSSVVQTTYKYYNHTISQSLTSADGIEYLYVGNTPWNDGGSLSYEIDNNFSKRRSINIKQSNRFNILQTIAEQFECWLNFNIKHDKRTGKIKYENGCPQKTVQIRKDIGIDTGVSFIYGIDLKSIQRTIQSDQIVSKTIVSANNNEFAKNGSCAISQSSENYPGVNFILNFDYYINQGLLDSSEINKDLYSSTEGIGYYFHLHQINSEYQKNARLIVDKKGQLTHYTSSLKIFEEAVSSLTEQISDLQSDLNRASGKTAQNEIDEWISAHLSSDYVWSCVNTLAQLNGQKTSYTNNVNSLTTTKQVIEEELKELEASQKRLVDDANELHEKFYRKYSRFIQEGTWTSEDYIDETLYFLDAQSVAYTSSRPQISYQIEVARLSGLEEFQNKIFNVGDIAYVQDPEFFGYTISENLRTPIKQPVVVSGVTSYFDEPSKDSFIVQNYKTQFEDLFQRITSTTQSLQYASGSYAKAANIINSNGTIRTDVLQASFAANENLVYSATNDTFVQDNTGITVSSLSNSLNKVRITSDGIFITIDGGTTWRSAIRGEGISTQYLTAGSINVGDIIIRDGNYVSFRWDSEGISAYAPVGQEFGGYDLGTFVRFDHYGLYGINGQSDFSPTSEDSIWEKASFGMTWKGFFLNNDDGSVCISSNNDIEVKKDGNSRIKIGRIDKKTIENGDGTTKVEYIYGIKISDGTSTVMETSDDGKLWLKDSLNIYNPSKYFLTEDEIGIQGKTYYSKTETGVFVATAVGLDVNPKDSGLYEKYNYKIQIGNLPAQGNDKIRPVINANNSFIVYEDGSLSATKATIEGSITATDGNIGCLEIAEEQILLRKRNSFEEKNPLLVFNKDSGLTIYQGGLSILIPNPNSDTTSEEEDFITGLGFDNNGQLTVNGSGSFSGNITAENLIAKFGEIGGFFISSNKLTSKDSSADPSIVLNGAEGYISAKNLKIGNGAEITDSLSVGQYVSLSGTDNNFLTVIDDKKKPIITWDRTGLLKVGNIELNGAESKISSEGNWSINSSSAEFKNITVSGKIVSTVFETNRIQAVGGSMICKPSFKVLSVEGTSITLDMQEGDWELFKNNPYILPILVTGQTGSVNKIIYQSETKSLTLKTGVEKEKWASIVVLGENGSFITTINSGDSGISDFGKAKGITISKLTVASDGKTGSETQVFMGDLTALNLSGVTGVGLYSQNVHLTGYLTTQLVDGSFAGVGTGSDSDVVFWGGASDFKNIESAPFRVTKDGTLTATKGVFSGIVESAEIKTAKLTDSGSGLQIANTNTNNGIQFGSWGTKNENGVEIETFTPTFSIKGNGLLFKNKPFISLPTNSEESNLQMVEEPIFSGAGQFSQATIDLLSIGKNTLEISKEDQGLVIKGQNSTFFGVGDIGVKVSNAEVKLTAQSTKVSSKFNLGGKMEYRPNGDYYDLYVIGVNGGTQ